MDLLGILSALLFGSDVEALGSPVYRVREAADARLAAAGSWAAPSLAHAARTTRVPERQWRAERLLARCIWTPESLTFDGFRDRPEVVAFLWLAKKPTDRTLAELRRVANDSRASVAVVRLTMAAGWLWAVGPDWKPCNDSAKVTEFIGGLDPFDRYFIMQDVAVSKEPVFAALVPKAVPKKMEPPK